MISFGNCAMKTLLVTGGAGFIGSNFIRLMLQQANVSIINLDSLTYAGNLANLEGIANDPRYKFVRGDICDPLIVESCMKQADAVVHFAAESHVDNSIASPNVFAKTNFMGTLTLLNAARNAKIERFVHISTDEVYGSRLEGQFTEEDPLDPSSPYSAAKASSDLLVKAYHKTYGLPVIITRSSNNYGPYQFPEKVIPLFITNLLEGKKVPLYGDGLNVRDWLYVTDNCRAIETVLWIGKIGETYNIAGNHELSNLELTKKILAALDKDDSSIEYVKDRPGHDRRYAISSSKMEELGWRPNLDFDRALRKTVDWYRRNDDWWKALKTKHTGQ